MQVAPALRQPLDAPSGKHAAPCGTSAGFATHRKLQGSILCVSHEMPQCQVQLPSGAPVWLCNESNAGLVTCANPMRRPAVVPHRQFCLVTPTAVMKRLVTNLHASSRHAGFRSQLSVQTGQDASATAPAKSAAAVKAPLPAFAGFPLSQLRRQHALLFKQCSLYLLGQAINGLQVSPSQP